MSLDRSILRIALPAIVSNITTPVLGLVDVAIVGHFGSAAFIGAIAIGGTMFNMLYWLFGFLRMGTAGLTAQAFGARDTVSQSATLRRSLAIALTLGVVLIALSPWLSPVILRFVDCEASSAHLAQRYFGICILGAPAVLGMYALTGWWLGMQDTRTPMCVAIGIDTANILVSLLLVYGLHLRIEGVATGTVAAQWLGFLAGLAFIALRYRPQRVALRRLLDRQALRRLFTVNTDIFLRTLCLVAVTVWFTRAGSEQGADILAANAVLMQLFMLFSYFSDGFAFAGEALAGKAIGAGDSASLRAVVRRVLVWGWRIATVFTVMYFVGGEAVLRMLTDDEAVRRSALEYLSWAAAIPLAGIPAFIYDGVFIGTTRTRAMLTAMAIAATTYFAAYFTLRPLLGNHGLWCAFIIYLAVRSLCMHLLYAGKAK